MFHECEVRIEKSVRGSLFGITRLFRVMPNSDPEERIFLSTTMIDSFSCIPFRSPAFDCNEGVAMNESCCFTLTSAILKVDVVCDVAMTSTPNVLTTELHGPYTTNVLTTRVVNRFFIYPMGRIRACKIRFVSTGENLGKLCLVCKSNESKRCR